MLKLLRLQSNPYEIVIIEKVSSATHHLIWWTHHEERINHIHKYIDLPNPNPEDRRHVKTFRAMLRPRRRNFLAAAVLHVEPVPFS